MVRDVFHPVFGQAAKNGLGLMIVLQHHANGISEGNIFQIFQIFSHVYPGTYLPSHS